FVFWSSYYANDVLTGIDRLNEYFDWLDKKQQRAASASGKDDAASQSNGTSPNSTTRTSEGRFEKLVRHLSNRGRTIIVFDGTEKLLRPNAEKTGGESISPEIKRFFKLISNQLDPIKCKVIMTTRLFPDDV